VDRNIKEISFDDDNIEWSLLSGNFDEYSERLWNCVYFEILRSLLLVELMNSLNSTTTARVPQHDDT